MRFVHVQYLSEEVLGRAFVGLLEALEDVLAVKVVELLVACLLLAELDELVARERHVRVQHGDRVADRLLLLDPFLRHDLAVDQRLCTMLERKKYVS